MKPFKFWVVFTLSLSAFIYHGTVFAAFDDVFYRNPADMSIKYLGDIFGIVGNALIGEGNSVLAEIFRIFNIIVLSLGTITVVYTVIASTLNTAQEGEVMGKKWSSMWLPLRSAGGLALLLPTSSGYSLIQILMMTIILKGVDAGNAVYNTVLDGAGKGQSIGASKQTVDNSSLKNQTINAFYISTCASYLNNYNELIDGNLISVYRSGDQVNIGVEGNPTYSSICGTATMASNPSSDNITSDNWKSAQLNSAESALSVASTYSTEAANADTTAWITTGAQISIARAMKTPLVSVSVNVSSDQTDVLTEAKKAGWLFAGVNYFKLIAPEGVSDYKPSPPTFTFNQTGLDGLDQEVNGTKIGAYIKTQSSNYLVATGGQDITSTEGTMLSRKNMAGLSQLDEDASEWANDMIASSQLGDTFEYIRERLVSGEGDALSSMRAIGTEIMQGLETAFWVMLGVTLAVAILVCFFAGLQPICSMFFTLISMLIPILLFFMTLLWSVGVLLGLYVPMIPYLVFTFGALAWIIMVIEAVVAAPIVSLGLVSPSGENLGKASNAVLLIANIFMRPSLMVIGLVIAAKLLDVAVTMLNFGFNYFMDTMTQSSFGFFANIALLIVYGGIVLALTHECFTLIHVLPDKINRWIGGQAEQSNVAKQMGEMQKTVQQASQTSLQMMQAGTKAIGEIKGALEKVQGKTGLIGGDGGGGLQQ
jgi:conjugal transfer/type IV secretion protein DotA/TraY